MGDIRSYPCLDCKERSPNCHSECPAYANHKASIRRAKESRNAEGVYTGYIQIRRDRVERAQKGHKRR